MSSQPSYTQFPPTSDRQANGRAATNSPLDWTTYPALFQRHRHSARHAAIHAEPEPPRPKRSGRDIREAFLGYCQAMLFTPESARYRDRPSERSAAADALAAAERFGWTREEIRRLGCGLYPSPAAVREHLRDVGFNDAEIDSAHLVCDPAGRPRAELTGNLVVPLADEYGRTRDYLLVAVDHRQSTFASFRNLWGSPENNIVAHGLQAALSRPATRDSLVLVENVLDSLLLQCRGLTHVVAVGGRGREFSPDRWEELARWGVREVTIAFRRDRRHDLSVREALVNALRARSAPAVYVADAYPYEEESLLDCLRRFGRRACETSLTARSLAFHDKHFGAAERQFLEAEYPRDPDETPEEPFYRIAFRQHLAELIAALPEEYRPAHQEQIAAVDEAIRRRDWTRLDDLLGEGYAEPWDRCGYDRTFSNAATILDRLGRGDRSPRVHRPAERTWHAERDERIEWLVEESASKRLEALCERILDACETRASDRFLVACGEHADAEIMLVLTTRLTNRLHQGRGTTTEDVRRHLAGMPPRGAAWQGPWLIDEAMRRLRGWSPRLEFVNCRDSRDPVETVRRSLEALDHPVSKTTLFIDGSAPDRWDTESHLRDRDWQYVTPTHLNCRIVATAPPHERPAATFHDIPASERDIREVLANWRQREREEADQA